MEQDEKDQIYTRAQRTVWLSLFKQCIRELGYDSPEVQGAAWISEREQTVAQLRMACDEHGDNDWPDDLHLADVVEKHLVRHLE